MILRLFFLLLLLVAEAARSVQAEEPLPTKPIRVKADQLSQVSVINSLMLGNYDGVVPLSEVLQQGNFGLGTVDQLDGELIILDGEAFHARSDGTVHRCPSSMTTPFAVVTPFEGEETFSLPGVSRLEQVDALIDARLPGPDLFLAVRVHTTFSSLWMRAVSRQEKPYRPLSEVTRNQSEWTLKDVTGTLIGLRSPKWVSGIGIPGYHWHFLSDDHTSGGHVFNVQFESADVSLDRCRTWTIQLDGLGSREQDLSQDLSREIEQVERKRLPARSEENTEK